jgi:aminoglycoside phosphotransferase (APT) family kinase protein
MTDWPATLEQQVAEIGGGGFGPAVDWAARQAPRRTRPSLLHLDFHPGNILVAGRELTGVIDWANGATGDAAADVGTTIVLLTMGPADAPPWLAPVLTRVRRWLARRYLAEYRRLNRVAVADVRYYEALRCLRSMVHVALRRAGSDSETREVYAWHGPQQVANMTGRFHEITGIRLPVPPIAGRQGGG